MIDRVIYRQVRQDDLGALRRVQGEAMRWLTAREGRDPSVIPLLDEPNPHMQHLLRTGPDLCWLAEADGRPVGFGAGLVRGEMWLLSNLFVHPDVHGRGIGQELLRRCFAAGRVRRPAQHGARIDAVVSSSHTSAQSLYVRLGLVPRFPLFILQGPVEGLVALPDPQSTVTRPTARLPWLERLSELDEMVWGRRREVDHRFWLGQSYATCLALQDDGPALGGYVYFTPDRIGPLAARSRQTQLQLLHLAGEAQMEGGAEVVHVQVPGINGTVLKELLRRRFRIDHLDLVMSSRPFGRFDRYLPSGGALL